MGAPLDGICFFSRGEVNTVHPICASDYLHSLIHQVVFPADPASMTRGSKLLADFILHVPAVAAACTPTTDAAKKVRDALDQL